ncbi:MULTISPECIES: BACON domain-containing protein [Niastella]|uniref:BACON domain-containing protein n=1 Tax=Niastella soli TaxID=2821487 RepID=A0ABS3YZK7_9BACT|nr:BACON domain-containing carbohydrate-binding protein [Niastella soli]MBO9203369.1 hypothetical protein [Niastella soli]
MKIIYPSPLKWLFLACLILQLIISCNKKSDAINDTVDPPASTPILKFTQQTLSLLPYTGASADLVIESNVDWQVSSSQNDWLQLSKTSGKGNDTIHLTVIKENLTTQTRTITLKAVATDGLEGLQSQIIIEQKFINVQLVSERAYGGSNFDYIYTMAKANDGGLLIAGSTGSQRNGDVGAPNHGAEDCWIARLNSNGDTAWTRSIGGSLSEYITSATATADGGFAVAGATYSSQSGDVRAVNHGGGDWFIVKLKSNGDTLWTRLVGGVNQDIANGITTTADGGIIVVGQTYSNTNEKDAMVVKFNSNGDIVWQKVVGGVGADNATSVAVTANGSILVAGWTLANNTGDIGNNHGSVDMWVLKLSGNGDKIWSKLYGGKDGDMANAIAVTPDDGFIIAGSSSSLDQDIVGKNHAQTQTAGDGYIDMWVVKLNPSGDIIWSNALGGPYDDDCLGVAVTPDGGCIAVGKAYEVGRDIEKIHENPDYSKITSDFWAVRLSNTGNKLWSKTYGSSESETANSIIINKDNSIYVGGYAYATSSVANGDRKSAHGADDGWLIKLSDF